LATVFVWPTIGGLFFARWKIVSYAFMNMHEIILAQVENLSIHFLFIIQKSLPRSLNDRFFSSIFLKFIRQKR